LSPPRLLSSAEASYPAPALQAEQEATVTLRLTIDSLGVVNGVEVVGNPGYGFGDAARDAALRFRFEPARRGDRPVPARILYKYEFRLPRAASSVDAGSVPAPGPSLPTNPATGAPVASDAGAPRAAAPGVVGDQAIDVTVQGASAADQMRHSAEAVKVVETAQVRRESSDLGEVLARVPGVGVQRAGGLGSDLRLSLNGLRDEQIRVFLDGVPLTLAGYPFGLANVPVNLISRVEVYGGVVPVRFGSDALGGVINLVSDERRGGNRAAASYEVGSFGTQRIMASGQLGRSASGLFARVDGFFDYADNDYPVDVEVPNAVGRLEPARVHRFHDAYRATGGSAEVGFASVPWARLLSVRAFVADYDKQLQHNTSMTVPYGDASVGETSLGGSLRYEQSLSPEWALEAVSSYALSRARFLDVGSCVYDWFGQCVSTRASPGELSAYRGNNGADQVSLRHTLFGRVNLSWSPSPQQTVRLVVTPSYFTQTGVDRRLSPDVRDPLSAQRDLFTLVSGLESETHFLDRRLEAIGFAKLYVQRLNTEEPRPGDVVRKRARSNERVGVGAALRYRFSDELLAKASYEWATRLPTPDEVFGDNALILANPELAPETSHNLNLALMARRSIHDLGVFRADAAGFLRDTDQLVLLSLAENGVNQVYQNVYAARSTGLELHAGWSAPGGFLTLDGSVTQQRFVNTSADGTFGAFEGQRLPNRPSLFASAEAQLRAVDLMLAGDELFLIGRTRFVDEFFLGWEGAGSSQYKATVPTQLTHSLVLGYLVTGERGQLGGSIEVQNLSNETVFDLYGVQKPGRAVYAKMSFQ
jgi:vitamin B12 transporter